MKSGHRRLDLDHEMASNIALKRAPEEIISQIVLGTEESSTIRAPPYEPKILSCKAFIPAALFLDSAIYSMIHSF